MNETMLYGSPSWKAAAGATALQKLALDSIVIGECRGSIVSVQPLVLASLFRRAGYQLNRVGLSSSIENNNGGRKPMENRPPFVQDPTGKTDLRNVKATLVSHKSVIPYPTVDCLWERSVTQF